MSLSVHELEAEARQLSAEDRADLAQRIFASLEGDEPSGSEADVEQAWVDEANRRYERYLAGETQSTPAADALARVRARLREG